MGAVGFGARKEIACATTPSRYTMYFVVLV